MKSIVYELESPFKLIQKEIDLSEDLAQEHILAETIYTAISPGTEMAAWVGKAPLRPSRAYPRLLGYCNLARVIKIGTAVSNVAVGDFILTLQSHRSAFICHQNDVILSVNKSEETQRKKLTATYLYHLGYSALLAGDFKPGHQVAIVGAGTIGLSTASLVKLYGLQPLLFTNQSVTSDFLHTFKKNPLDHKVFQHLCGMDGVDIVINTSNEWSDYLLSLKIARKGGQIICLGFPGREETQPPFNPLDSQYLYDKQLTVKQCGYMTNSDLSPIDIRFTLKRNIKYLSTLILDGLIDPMLILNRESPWDCLGEVYQQLALRQKNVYSILIKWKS